MALGRVYLRSSLEQSQRPIHVPCNYIFVFFGKNFFGVLIIFCQCLNVFLHILGTLSAQKLVLEQITRKRNQVFVYGPWSRVEDIYRVIINTVFFSKN